MASRGTTILLLTAVVQPLLISAADGFQSAGSADGTAAGPAWTAQDGDNGLRSADTGSAKPGGWLQQPRAAAQQDIRRLQIPRMAPTSRPSPTVAAPPVGHSLRIQPAARPLSLQQQPPAHGEPLSLPATNLQAPPPTSPGTLFAPPAVPPSNIPQSDAMRPAAEVPPVPLTEQRPTGSGYYTFNYRDAPWLSVIREFCREAGYSVQLAKEPRGTLTYYDERRYTRDQFLDILNDHLLETGALMVRDGQRVTVVDSTSSVPDHLVPFVPLTAIDGLGRNELASVPIPMNAGNVNQAVEEVEQLKSPVGRVQPLTNSGRLIVTDTGAYLRRIRDLLLGSGVAAGNSQSVVYALRHAKSDDVAEAINNFMNGRTSAESPEQGGPRSSGSTMIVSEKATNSLLMKGTSEELAAMHYLIAELDRPPREVLVQALLVEVELGNTNELGVELGFQDSVLFDRSVVDNLITLTQTTTAPNGTQTTNQQVVSQTSAPGFSFNNQPLGNNTAANPNYLAGQGLSSFGVGRVNGDLGFGGLVLSAGSESVNLLLRALDAQFNIDILSRPQVRTVENNEALMQIGQQVPIVDGVNVTSVGSANPVIRQEQAGIILKVTPRISPDGRVQIDVNAEKSAFNLAPGTGVPIFTDATNGNVIEAPVKDITTADTVVSVQSGQTVVLGGMITNDQATVARKVPWLGDLPLVGRLFRYDLHDHRRRELLVFLTPIVLDDARSEWTKQQAVDQIHMPPDAYSFGDQLTATVPGHSFEAFGFPATSGPAFGNRSSERSAKADSGVRPASFQQPAPTEQRRFGSGFRR